MKTNVIMKSVEDRELFGVVIKQNTKGGMLSLTDLQEAYTHARVLHGWSDKDISNILNNEQNIERIFYILREQKCFDKTTNSWFYENDGLSHFKASVTEKSLTKVLKELELYKTTGRGENKTVYCNPYIWVLVAMELNPMIYAKVVTWLTDKLIANRIEACDLNINLRNALHSEIKDPDYSAINMALNTKIFGHHETGMRNLASEEELKKLNSLQESIAFCIRRGFLRTNEDVINEINKQLPIL